MVTILIILIIASLILLIIGLIKPKSGLFWFKGKVTRLKSFLIYGGSIILFIILLGVIPDTSNPDQSTVKKEIVRESKPKIEKVTSKKEKVRNGHFNQLTVFYADSAITFKELKEFCTKSKPDYSDGVFQTLVFFKNKKAAKVNDYPIIFGYAKEENLVNIKAIYEINNLNGYSKLTYYKDNAYNSLPQTVDIK